MSLRYDVIVLEDLIQPPSVKSCYHQGFFAVKRRAVFILGAKWKALVRGRRRDCVVGGMETHFQWRKAHSHIAKCEAFHIAPRLFFMFLFLITFTIRQQYIIYPQEFSTEPSNGWTVYGRTWIILSSPWIVAWWAQNEWGRILWSQIILLILKNLSIQLCSPLFWTLLTG